MCNGIIIVNKPKGMTSYDVCSFIKKQFSTKKVGHAGTLDPLATGVLVVGINKGTKALQFLTSDKKLYRATLTLGESTTTYDSEGEVVESKAFNGYENLEDVLNSFLGTQIQTPPIYSAIKVKGKKLYEYARENKEVEVPKREITIDSMTVIEENENTITFDVVCSKGTYIRSLCVDIAKKLGYPGHMSALIRLSSGCFSINDAQELKDDLTVTPIEEAFKNYDKIMIEDENIVYHGKKINKDIDHYVAVFNTSGQLLAIYGPDGHGQLKSIRGLF